MRLRSAIALLGVAVGCAPAAAPPPAPPPQAAASAAPARPIPYPVEPPPEFRQAIAQGTRTAEGRPGPAYWQNWTEYRIRARVRPESRRLEGSAAIRYHNRSPDTLNLLVLDLTQNFHAEGAARLEPAEVTGGIELTRVTVQGRELRADARSGPRYVVDATKLILLPPGPVAPGARVDLEVDWAFTVPQAGAGGRMGYSGDELLFLAYWYPRMTVYDDVVGWHPDPFLGPAEFYHGFGTYEYTVEAPAGWVVLGTGELANAEEALAPDVVERLRAAERSDSVVRVLGPADPARATRAAPDGLLRWSFRADSVRDVAFSMTRGYLWDAARTPVGDRNGDGATEYARVDALYRPTAPRWRRVAHYAQHAIRFLSEFTGLPYPWSHMTAVEGGGIIGGGMEYPMMTLIGDYNAAGDSALYYVTAHELAHMWVPMILSTDERRYSWMDEGTTTFHENEARRDFFPGVEHHLSDRRTYLEAARAGIEGEIMRRSDYHYPGPAFGVASYPKPAAVLHTLRGLLGEETFRRAYRDFIDAWAFRHPYPWDLWNTFERVSGRELDWFWRSWYYETWLLDQAVAQVTDEGSATRVVIEDRGDVPMPARLTITREDGRRERHEVPVDTWLRGERRAVLTLPAGSPVVRVEIDAENAFPDADRSNNVWTRGS